MVLFATMKHPLMKHSFVNVFFQIDLRYSLLNVV